MNKLVWHFEQEVIKAFRGLIELKNNRNELWVSIRDTFPEQGLGVKEMLASGKLEETKEYNVYLITKDYYEFLKEDVENGLE